MSNDNRVPAGVPTGGEFATGAKAENPDLPTGGMTPQVRHLCDLADAATIITPRERLEQLHSALADVQDEADSDEVDDHVVHLLALMEDHVPVVSAGYGQWRFGDPDDSMLVNIQVPSTAEWLNRNGADLAKIYQQGVRGKVTIRNTGTDSNTDDSSWKALVGHNGSTDADNGWARMTINHDNLSGWSVRTPRTGTEFGDNTGFGLQEAMDRAARKADFLDKLDAASGLTSGAGLLTTQNGAGDDKDAFWVHAFRSIDLGPVEAFVKHGEIGLVRNTRYPDNSEAKTWAGLSRMFGLRAYGDEVEPAVRKHVREAYRAADAKAWAEKNLR